MASVVFRQGRGHGQIEDVPGIDARGEEICSPLQKLDVDLA
ncbi:MAG: hypothetical protein QOH59_67, partial [Gemmatimonadales bacterium]|nr:hypothetical protein [Gemmatimonadales bacterium]